MRISPSRWGLISVSYLLLSVPCLFDDKLIILIALLLEMHIPLFEIMYHEYLCMDSTIPRGLIIVFASVDGWNSI